MATGWRVTLVAVALVVAAWFALGVRQAVNTTRATALITGPGQLTPARGHDARSLLDSAATLNPDRTVNLLRGELALAQNHNASAQRILLALTHSEPQNLDAWVQLAYAAARNHDRALLVLTGRKISALYPKLH
jgi:predicted Zn-dependent protease